ncbi:MAG: amidohydrolase family protein [Bacteroidota bacterium]
MSSQATILKDGIIYTGGRFEQLDVRIERGTIAELLPSISTSKKDVVIDVAGHAVVPGLINSHDHLEFNLFPKLGRPPYKNYVEWAEDVQKNFQEQIKLILQIPLKDRLLWGGYKNLFSGVTTGFQHNSYHPVFKKEFPIRVHENYTWIHSLRLDSELHSKLASRDGRLCAIHLAEGVDELAGSELRTLDSLGGLTDRTIIVHGIGLGDNDLERLVAKQSALVWCPSSNHYLFGRTAPVERLVGRINVALGTDSTISGGIDLFSEMRHAQWSKSFTPGQIIDMVTRIPARVLGLNAGEINLGRDADLLIFRPRNSTDPLQFLFTMSSTQIACVVKGGKPVFGSLEFEKFFDRFGAEYSQVSLNGEIMLATGDFPGLGSRIKKYLGQDGVSSDYPLLN